MVVQLKIRWSLRQILKHTFFLAHHSHLSLTKPLGYTCPFLSGDFIHRRSSRSDDVEADDLADMSSGGNSSNFARRMIATSSMVLPNTPLHSDDGSQDTSASLSDMITKRQRSSIPAPTVMSSNRYSLPSSSSGDAAIHPIPPPPQFQYTATFNGDDDEKEEEEHQMPSPITRSSRSNIVAQEPLTVDVSSDKLIKHLPQSFLGPHAGGGMHVQNI